MPFPTRKEGGGGRERERERERDGMSEGRSMGIADAHFLEGEDPSISLEAATCLLPVVGSIIVSDEL